MRSKNAILDEYRNGDFEERLTLFLHYRDIRNEFLIIDETPQGGRSDGKKRIEGAGGSELMETEIGFMMLSYDGKNR